MESAKLLLHRRELEEVLYALEETRLRGVLLLGGPGSGKTSLLQAIRRHLDDRGSEPFYVSMGDMRDPGDLPGRVADVVERSPYKDAMLGERTIRSSAGARSFEATAEILAEAGRRLRSPVLLLDDLDGSAFPLRASAAVDQLSNVLVDWKFVVAARRLGTSDHLARRGLFRIVELRPLDALETGALLDAVGLAVPPGALRESASLSGGNPLFVTLLAESMLRDPSFDAVAALSAGDLLESLVSRAVSPGRGGLGTLLEQIALAGGLDRIASLAATAGLPDNDVQALLEGSPLVAVDAVDRTVAFVHARIRDVILARILTPSFALADLTFGNEAAERDDLLDRSFVHRTSLAATVDQDRTIVLGDRGSGKSAIFRKLLESAAAAAGDAPALCPITDRADLLHRIVDKDAEFNAEMLKAAWLVIVARAVASAIPDTAPKALRRSGSALTAAFGLGAKKASRGRRVVRAAARPFAGTTLKIAVGPAGFEVKLPEGSTKAGAANVDVEAFLRDADEFFRGSGKRAIALVDRIDEGFKYDRKRQEPLVQGLFLAEGRISLLSNIGLVLFVRTDLFEIYDIQEKTKLVSRTLTLEWSEEDWLRLLINRVLVNPQVERLAEALNYSTASGDLSRALEAIFPSRVEGQPVERWLIDSLKNGNGDISPRAAVLLLHLTHERNAKEGPRLRAVPHDDAREEPKSLQHCDLSERRVIARATRPTTRWSATSRSRARSFAWAATGPSSRSVGRSERASLNAAALLGRRRPTLYTRCWDSA